MTTPKAMQASAMSYFVTGTILVAAFLFGYLFVSSSVANAQEADPVAAKVVPQEVAQDFQVTQQDLGAADATVLPDSPLHIFKRMGWFVTEAFTFDPLADAQLKLQHANQELYEIKLLADTKGIDDPGVAADVADATARITDRLASIAGEADALKAAPPADQEAVQQLLADVVDHQINADKVLGVVEEQVEAVAAPADVVDFHEARNQEAEEVAAALTGAVDKPEQVADILEQVFGDESQAGSEFVDFKNLEILKKLEDAVPAEAVPAIELAQENMVARLEEKLGALPEEERADKLVEYANYMPGDETRLLAVCDDLKDFVLPDDVAGRLEEMKDVMANRMADKLEQFKDEPEVRDALLAPLAETDNLEDIRTLSDISGRIVVDDPELKQEIELNREESVKLFTEHFTDDTSGDQAERFSDLSRQMAEKPDPTTMKLLLALEQEVRSDPAKAAFVDQMQDVGKNMRGVFEEKFKREGDAFMDRVATNDPRDLEVMRAFAQKFQGSAQGDGAVETNSFAAFESKQKAFITEQAKTVDNPEVFRAMQERFRGAAPTVVQEMQSYGNFKDVFNQKATVIQERAIVQEAAKVRQELQQQQAGELFTKLQGVTDEGQKQQVLQQFQERQATQLEQGLKAQESQLRAFSSFNPFCDATCQQSATQRFTQKFEQQNEQFKQQAGEDVQKHAQQFEEFKKSGQFPGRGATEGVFPGQGATEGIFPGRGAQEGEGHSITGQETTITPKPVEYKSRTYPTVSPESKPVEEFKDYTAPKAGEPGMYPKPGDTATYTKPSETPTSFDDYFKTYQPKPGDTTTYPKPGETTAQPVTTQPTSGYQMTPEQKQMADQYNKQPSTGTAQPSTGITQPTSGDTAHTYTQPTSGGTTYTQPTYTQPTYTPPPTEPAPTYTAPTYTEPAHTDYMMPHASVWQRLARALYAFLTFPARAFGL